MSAFVEAAIVKAIETPGADPEFERALSIVAHAVKDQLSPQGLRWLESLLTDDERAGAVRWRNLAKFQMWLAQCRIPTGTNSRKLTDTRFTNASERRLHTLAAARDKIHQLSMVRVPGRTLLVIYRIAKRANVGVPTVIAALLNFGLERMAEVIRQTREVPPVTTDAFPISTPPA